MSKKTMIISIIAVVIATIAIVFIFTFHRGKVKEISASELNATNLPAGLQIVTVNEKKYCQHNGEKWNGNYMHKGFSCMSLPFGAKNDFMKIMSYNEYSKFMKALEKSQVRKYVDVDENGQLGEEHVETVTYKTYSNTESNYVVLYLTSSTSARNMTIYNLQINEDDIIIYGDEDSQGWMSYGSGCIVVIPIDKPISTPVKYVECYSSKEISNLRNYGKLYNPDEPVAADKPILYLYPKTESNVVVELKKPELITCSYPKYESQWSVLAKPDGTLTEEKSGKELYALYYESETEHVTINDGFVVKGEDSASFLEEKLSLLGLTDREAEEFIVYWLPKLELNPYNLIHFATEEEIDNYMPIEITPKPDNFIRVWMVFEGLNEPIEIEEQKLTSPERDGFVAVEWGGIQN